MTEEEKVFNKIMQAYLNGFGDKKYGIEILKKARSEWEKEIAEKLDRMDYDDINSWISSILNAPES